MRGRSVSMETMSRGGAGLPTSLSGGGLAHISVEVSRGQRSLGRTGFIYVMFPFHWLLLLKALHNLVALFWQFDKNKVDHSPVCYRLLTASVCFIYSVTSNLLWSGVQDFFLACWASTAKQRDTTREGSFFKFQMLQLKPQCLVLTSLFLHLSNKQHIACKSDRLGGVGRWIFFPLSMELG